jgi:phosphatidylserine decarboxylase
LGRFQAGRESQLTQIKGLDYRLEDLVGPGWDLADYRDGGGWMTIYLAPYNYHRIHSPLSGEITQVSYLPGALWPVNTWSVSHIPGLFVVNERIAVEISGAQGKAILVMVGATNVGRITLDFNAAIAGNARPRSRAGIWKPAAPIPMEKGQGLGCFELGSTVILVLSASLASRLDPQIATSLPSVLRMGRGLSSGLGT